MQAAAVLCMRVCELDGNVVPTVFTMRRVAAVLRTWGSLAQRKQWPANVLRQNNVDSGSDGNIDSNCNSDGNSDSDRNDDAAMFAVAVVSVCPLCP